HTPVPRAAARRAAERRAIPAGGGQAGRGAGVAMRMSPGHVLAGAQIARHGKDRYPTVLQQMHKVMDEAAELLGALVEHAEIHGASGDYLTCSHIKLEFADVGLALYELGNKLGLDLIYSMADLVDGDRRDFRKMGGPGG